MIDRFTAPAFNTLKKVNIPKVKNSSLSNGRSVFYLNDTNTQVFKIELILRAGSWYASNYALVPTTLKLLNEGTINRNAKELADTIDKYGSFIEFIPGFDNCSVSLYGLSKYFSQNLGVLAELIFSPAFDEQSFTNLKIRDIEKLKLNLEKGNYLASVALRQNTFGEAHPYGKRLLPEDIENISLNSVKDFYNEYFQDFDVIISGNLPSQFIQDLDKTFGKSKVHQSQSLLLYSPEYSPEKRVAIKSSKFIQSSIRIGKQLFNRSHTDYMSFMLLNEVLGGYFGSRLMKNIREEKGFTYGIYSQLYSLNHSGYFSISTDVNGENESDTIEEIFKEIKKLQSELIQQNELETVKNYMSGTFAGSISSTFSIMDKFKATYYQNLGISFFENYLEAINTVQSDSLLSLAIDYLDSDSLSVITVGS